MQEIQVLDVGYNSLFPDIDTIGTERIGDYVVMLTSFGTDCISSYGCYPTYEVAAHQARCCMAEDAKDGLSGYAYEIWHLVDDATEDATEDAPRSDMLLASFVPLRDKSLPLYSLACNKWSDVLAWIGAMLPLIDMASYELTTSTV